MSSFVLTDKNFKQEILDFEGTVLVDFSTEYCPACRVIAPAISEIAEEYKGRAKIGELNATNNPQATERCGIMSIPTLIFFKNGKIIDRMLGAQPKIKIKEKLEVVLKS